MAGEMAELRAVLQARGSRARTAAASALSAATVLGWVDWTAAGSEMPARAVAALVEARAAAERAREAAFQASEALATAAGLLESAALQLARADLGRPAAADQVEPGQKRIPARR